MSEYRDSDSVIKNAEIDLTFLDSRMIKHSIFRAATAYQEMIAMDMNIKYTLYNSILYSTSLIGELVDSIQHNSTFSSVNENS